MKRIFTILCAVVMAAIAIAQPAPQGRPQQERAQQGKPQQERTQQGRPQQGEQPKPNRTVEMLRDQLKMSQEAAEKFAPIYQGMQREMRQVRKELKAVTDYYKQKPLDIKTAVKIMNAQLNADKEIIQIKKEYIKVFRKHLTPDQLSKVFVIKPRARRPQGGKPGQGPRQGGNRQGQGKARTAANILQ